jgi:TonB family protein
MTTAVANPDDFGLGKFVVFSVGLHALFAGLIILSIVFRWHGSAWGDVGASTDGAVNVKLASNSSLAALPMPTPPVIDDSKTFDPTNSLYKETVQPKPPEIPKDVEKIPKLEKEKPKPIEHKSRVMDNKTPPPPNTINQHGGQPQLRSGYAQTPNNAASGVQIQGATGGDFAGRYPAYVAAMIRKISQNWNQSSIDPAARGSRSIHATVVFTIMRDGTVKDIHIAEGSRNSSFDNSGLRALYDASPMPQLPADYNGTYLTVTFDFLPPGTQSSQ